MKLIALCGALAAGEYLASFVSPCADLWPVALATAVLVALFGYGWNIRGWPLLSVALLGVALFFANAVAGERNYREKPWMRGCERRSRQAAPAAGETVKRVKRNFARRMDLGLERTSAVKGLNRALLLGERKCLSAEMKRLFVESGTMHVFAISGLHVMAIAEILAVILSFALVPRRFLCLVQLPLLWGYVYMIGLPPSAVRAAMMATFSGLAPLFWRRPDGLRSWALTFLLVHLLDPQMIVNVGNALSFAVMLAIVLAGEGTAGLPKWSQTLLITFVAWAVGVPISAHVFGRVTPGGILANLVLIGAAKVTVMAGATGLVASFVSHALAAHVNNLYALGIQVMVTVADGVSRLPFGNLDSGRWSLLMCAEWYLALALAAGLFVRLRRRRQAFLGEVML